MSRSSSFRQRGAADTLRSVRNDPEPTPTAPRVGTGPGTSPARRAAQQLNPWLKFIDGVSHGFVVVDVTPERVQADFHHTPVPSSAAPDPRVDPQVVPTYARSLQTRAGTHRLTTASGPVGGRSDEPA